jgi:ABC-2 type transport system ATP-binding protein
MLAVETSNLCKSFTKYESFFDRVKSKGKKVEALKNVNLQIKKGEIFGLLGPNGAGKTTLLNIISTLLLPDSGIAKVFGFDVTRETNEVRKIMSLSSAYSSFYDELSIRENLKFYAMLYNLEVNFKNFISLLDLEEYENKEFGELSTGNKQKAIIARSLMVNPKLLLLDEMTVALDPNITLKVRKIIKSWREKNKTTILLATHNMYEADEMCDRVAIIHKGEIVACDTPANLKKMVREEDCIEIKLSETKILSLPLMKIKGVKGIVTNKNILRIYVDDAESRLQNIVETLLSKNLHIKAVKVKEPTLEDVFLKLTGARLR